MKSLITIVSLFVTLQVSAQRRMEFNPTNPNVHDPVMALENGKYHIYATGFGISELVSSDMITWKHTKPVMDNVPEWAQVLIPAYKGHTWAPDIKRVGDKWYLYYSCSAFGKNTSAIGVMINNTLNRDSADYNWTDLGLVVKSMPKKSNWNAIDPNLILDEKGTPWLTFGSFWDGIQLVKLKADMKTISGKTVTIARRRAPGVKQENAIEAPFIIRYDGYYYLFVSHDYCCRGLQSDYKTVVGRSKKITGPYLDREGIPMTKGGGTLVAGPCEKYSGVGHCSVYEFEGQWYFVAHGYDKENRGASRLFLRRIEWQDGWPVLWEK